MTAGYLAGYEDLGELMLGLARLARGLASLGFEATVALLAGLALVVGVIWLFTR